jgi:type II secretory pathway component GspD/PulD (secretin)
MIEAIVTEMSEAAARSLGSDWLITGSDGSASTFNIAGNYATLADSSFFATVSRLGRTWGDYDVNVITTLRALEDDGQVDIRANPRLATLTGRAASIFIGREEYYSIVTGPISYPYSKLELIQVGITLNVIPYVSSDGEITVDIKPEVSDVTGMGTSELPVVSKRSVTTKVRVRDGETITVGGLRLKTERSRRTGIPFLCNIPVLGYLFGHDVRYVDESEIVVFITPRLMEE